MANETRIIQVCQGTTSQWNSAARVLEPGEFGYDTTLKIVKIGDGTTTFANLPTFLNGTNATSLIAAATTTTVGLMSAADKTKLDGIATGAQVNVVTKVAGKTGAVTLAKADVGLGNVDNTSDADKPVSTATTTALGLKVDKVTGKGLSTNDFTTAEKTKLAGLESSHFKGEYTTITALNGVTGAAGDYAYVDAGSGQDVTAYVWDTSNSKWVEQKGITTAETSATVKTKYEANADTNAYTDAEKSKLAGIAAGAQVNAVTSVAGRTGAVVLTKNDVSLPNVDNTTDASKVVASAAKLTTARTVDGMNFDGSAAITHYGTCATAAATAAKTVALTGFSLVTGAEITVMFTVTNTAANPTLNVNGTGAKAIYYRNAAITAGYLAANRVYKFVYDGTQWELIGDINVDTDTTYAVATVTTAGLMSATDKAKLSTMKVRTAVLSGGDPTMALAAYE
jgi:hypothetical protein